MIFKPVHQTHQEPPSLAVWQMARPSTKHIDGVDCIESSERRWKRPGTKELLGANGEKGLEIPEKAVLENCDYAAALL